LERKITISYLYLSHLILNPDPIPTLPKIYGSDPEQQHCLKDVLKASEITTVACWL
jgi:hypothetical protein